MIQIALRTKRGIIRGHALVDDEDACLAERQWHLNKGAARSFFYVGGVWVPRYMHRVILDVAEPRVLVDHINGDKLDNRRENLRFATTAENAQNRHRRQSTNPSSVYRGVTFHGEKGKWVARARLNGKLHHLGYFSDEHEAGAVVAAWRRDHMPFSPDARDVVFRLEKYRDNVVQLKEVKSA
jgi:hypothetical protein